MPDVNDRWVEAAADLARAEEEWTAAYSRFDGINQAVRATLESHIKAAPGSLEYELKHLDMLAETNTSAVRQQVHESVSYPMNRSVCGWDDPRWAMVKSLGLVGDVAERDERFDLSEEVDNALLAVGTLPEVSLPALLPNPAVEHVLLRSSHQAAVPVVETLLVRLLTTTPGVRIHILDPQHHGTSLARFSAANTDNPSRGQVFEPFVTSHAEVPGRLSFLSQYVTNISHRVLRGSGTLQEHNASSAAKETVHVVVAFDVDSYPRGARDDLERLAQSKDGSVLVVQHHSPGSTLPVGADPHLDVVSGVERLAGWKVDRMVPPPKELVEGAIVWAEALQRFSIRTITLLDLIPTAWTPAGPSLKGVVGTAGVVPFEISLGVTSDPHMLVIGQSGSGKSTFLHALVTSLAATYSPEDLNFVLLDGKEGVEMSAYVPGPTRLSFLPHVKVAAVNTDIRMYVSVLENLKEEIRLRNQLFREAGAVDILDYKARTGATMPRLVALMDEFQVLMQAGKHQDTVVALLADVARRGRSAGIHLVLATQTLRGINAVALGAALDQITNRVALQCDPRNSEMVLGDGNTAANSLAGHGQAVLNIGRTGPERNVFFQVGFLTGAQRDVVVHGINQRAAEGLKPPVVLQGGESVSATQAGLLNALSAPGEPSVCLGGPLSVRGPVWGDFVSEDRRNIVFLGSDDPTGMLVASTLALAAAKPEARFIVCESRFRSGSATHVERLVKVLEESGRNVTFLRSTGPEEERPGAVVKALTKEVSQAVKDGSWVNDDRGVFLVVPDGRVLPKSALKDLLESGPERGVQSIVQASTVRMLTDITTGSNIVSGRPLEPFGLRVLTTLEAASNARNILGDVQSRHPNAEEGRNTFESLVDNDEVQFIPVRTPTESEWVSIEQVLRSKQ